MISITEADWSREKPRQFWDPSRKLLAAIRRYQRHKAKKSLLSFIFTKLAVIQHRLWSVVTGADIPLMSRIGGGLLIPHPNGIVIHPDAVIGVNCLIHQQVTIGVKRGNERPPILAGHVDIGAGAKIIGPIEIGHDSLVGANSVVVKDVPANTVVAGIPAKTIGST